MPFSNRRVTVETSKEKKLRAEVKKEQLKEEVESLSVALEEMEARQKEVDATAEEIAELKDIRKDLTGQINKKNARLKELDEEIAAKESTVRELGQAQADLGIIEAEIAAKKQALENLEQQLAHETKERDSVSAEIEAAKTEQQALTGRLTSELAALEKEYHTLREQDTALRAEYALTQSAVETNRKELSQIANEIAKFEVQKETLSQEIASLVDRRNAEIAEFDTKLAEKKALLESELEAQRQVFQENCDQKLGEISLRERQAEIATKRLQEAKRKLEELSGRSYPDITI